MPRVVPDQRDKFENDELFRKLSRETEIRYTGFRDRQPEERHIRFQSDCREGHADIGYPGSGINLQLAFVSNAWSDVEEDRVATQEFVDFQREHGKVHLKSQFIMNGVSVMWRGWIDLQRLDGAGWLEFDEERARVEDQILREQIEQYNRHLHGIDDQQRHLQEEREQRAEVEAEVSTLAETAKTEKWKDEEWRSWELREEVGMKESFRRKLVSSRLKCAGHVGRMEGGAVDGENRFDVLGG
ncbi:Protein big brother [Lamellibrachia satsuma]|nr:Protein big brother [Lamellibrachia satsuma]